MGIKIYNPDIHNRKSIRLKDYDYTSPGAYYITICVNNRDCVFGNVRNGEMVLNDAGIIADKCWNGITVHFPYIELDEFIIMPNHLHGIIHIADKYTNHIVGAGFPRPCHGECTNDICVPRPHENSNNNNIRGRGNRAPTLGHIIAYFKYGTTKQFNTIGNTAGIRLWQRNYYEHIIRTEADLRRIREYIINNPAQWDSDPENPSICVT